VTKSRSKSSSSSSLSQLAEEKIGERFGVVGDLLVGEAEDVVAEAAQLQIPVVVVLEGGRAAVVPVAVRFDDQAAVAPEEVDEVRSDPHVHLRRGKPVSFAQPKEEVLQLAAGSLGYLDPGRQAQDLRLPDRPTDL
jgi:hypothetical protein